MKTTFKGSSVIGAALVFAALSGGCGKSVLGNMLTQRQVLHEWVASFPEDMVSTDESDKTSSALWLVPKSTNVSEKEVDDRIGDWFGGRICIWKYEVEKLDEVLYINSVRSDAVPVSSRGVTLSINYVRRSNKRDNCVLVAEDIFMVCDSTVTSYDQGNLDKAGWKSHGINRYTFTIPRNDSGKERFWCVKMFEEGRGYYDMRVREGMNISREWARNKRWPVANLCFIQVTDTVYPELTYKKGHSKWSSLLPACEKWIPDPEGGYKF